MSESQYSCGPSLSCSASHFASAGRVASTTKNKQPARPPTLRPVACAPPLHSVLPQGIRVRRPRRQRSGLTAVTPWPQRRHRTKTELRRRRQRKGNASPSGRRTPPTAPDQPPGSRPRACARASGPIRAVKIDPARPEARLWIVRVRSVRDGRCFVAWPRFSRVPTPLPNHASEPQPGRAPDLPLARQDVHLNLKCYDVKLVFVMGSTRWGQELGIRPRCSEGEYAPSRTQRATIHRRGIFLCGGKHTGNRRKRRKQRVRRKDPFA